MYRSNKETATLVEKLICINKVSKTTTGGRRLAFAALVVVGDCKGRVGFGSGKAKEVTDARNKALENAKRFMIRVPLKEGRTIHHDCEGKFGRGHVIMRPAAAGTGIISGGPMRAIFECLGVQDVVSKSLGTNNPHGMILATFEALKNMHSPRSVADRRSKHISEIVKRRNMVTRGKKQNNIENTSENVFENAAEETMEENMELAGGTLEIDEKQTTTDFASEEAGYPKDFAQMAETAPDNAMDSEDGESQDMDDVFTDDQHNLEE
jgi:small subunit ribosomal protein S5